MSRRRGLARLVDPWAALLLGVLVVLGVVILLATPGPWHKVVGPAPVRLVKPLPRDIALYVQTPSRGRCTTVVWLHVEYDKGTVAVVLVPPETQVPVEAGGFAPVGRLVGDAGPSPATAGLADILQTPMGGYVVVGRDTVRRVVSATRAPGPDKLGKPAFRQALTALSTEPLTRLALSAQQRVLARVLSALPYELLNQGALVNYVLGSTEVDTDLDLRVGSAIAKVLHGIEAGGVAVRTLPVIVERCGPASRWRLDQASVERLRLSLEYGLRPPASVPITSKRRTLPEVVVAAPGGGAAESFAAALARRLSSQTAEPLTVRLETDPSTVAGAAALRERMTSVRPLAVVIAPWLGRPQSSVSPSPSTSPSQTDVVGTLLSALAKAAQPVVLVAPSAGDVPAARGAIAPAPLVIASASTGQAAGAALSSVQLARLTADTLVRSCWPDYLAPDLSGTRLGFSYAARRATTLALLSGDTPADLRLAIRLGAAGYTLRPLASDAWAAPAAGVLIAFTTGEARAARALQGDVDGLLPSLPRRRVAVPLFPVKSAPEPVTLVLGE